MKSKLAKVVALAACTAAVATLAYGLWRHFTSNPAFQADASVIPDVPGKSKSDSIKIDLPAKIDEARQVLVRTQAGYKVCEDDKICGSHTVLAVAHGTRGSIELVYVSADGDTTGGYTVEYSKKNGVNTDFQVTHPEGYLVLALRRGIKVEGNEFREVVYTPYTKEIDEPSVRARGREYLQNLVKEAHVLAMQRGLKSKAFKGDDLGERIPMNVAITLALIEHMEPARVKRGDAESELNELFTVLGANTRVAYNYTVSKAGARGLFQFMPATYTEIRNRNPEAQLKEGIGDGMRDHVNAALASFLLFDSDLALLSKEERSSLAQDPLKLGEYLAAAYNGGAPKAKAKKLARETREYVEKFNIVYTTLFVR